MIQDRKKNKLHLERNTFRRKSKLTEFRIQIQRNNLRNRLN